jgi:SNF2 family DNA or RNA helicase
VDVFNNGGAAVALCSIQACGHGVNFTAANHVIHFDRWWNPAVEDQATDRVHRIGQEKTVYVHRFLVQDTIEEKIDLLLERKRSLAATIIGADILAPKQLTREDLLQILRPLN